MEHFVLTMRRRKGKKGAVDLILQMWCWDPQKANDAVVREWKVQYTHAGGETQVRTLLKVMERRGVLTNAQWADAPKAFDGSAREFAQFAFDRDYQIGRLTVSDHSEGMRLALAFALAGRCNTVTRMHRITDGLTNLPVEVVLYWFTLCHYGQQQKAGKAALFTLCNTRG